MKKTLFLAALAAEFASCGNNDSPEVITTSDTEVSLSDSGKVSTVTTTTTTTYTAEDGDVMWKDVKLLMYQNGDWTVAEKDITLEDGTVISVKGNVTGKDGKMISLKEGESVKKTGQLFDKAGNAIANAWDAAKEGVKDAGEAVKEGAKDAAHAVKEGAEDAGKAIKDGAKKASDKAKKVVDSLKH